MGEREKGLSKVKERRRFLQGNLYKSMNKATVCYTASQEGSVVDGFFAGFRKTKYAVADISFVVLYVVVSEHKSQDEPILLAYISPSSHAFNGIRYHRATWPALQVTMMYRLTKHHETFIGYVDQILSLTLAKSTCPIFLQEEMVALSARISCTGCGLTIVLI
ncbi:hypothetical protein SADUNF_Sadunf10G0113700 [Salix dunnii]|uniref:Uncharacterized protein n=1 Tax=Salix dunnii TaxID=1413687 RepID=A0A835JRK1_9ROSI|nr:hypothetical protein SADUNF_Sadunf10G0113700 [Salix dunnii]